MAFLPKEVEYNRPHASVSPDTTSLNVIVRPSNGQTFQAGGDVITFDLPSRAFLSPASLVLRGVMTSTVATADDTNFVLGAAPGASWIQRVETQISGQTVESINSYGQLYNLLVNTKLGVSERMAMQTELMTGTGVANAVIVPSAANISSYALPSAAGAQTSPFAIPLGCLLSNCTNYVPLGLMGGVRVSITTDQLANFTIMTGAATLTFGSLELAFDMVDFGRGFDSVVGSMADSEGNINLKSSSWNVSSQTLGAITAGTTEEHIYNVRLSSIKSLILQAGGISANSVNGAKFDAGSVQGNGGSTIFTVASQVYPQTPIAESNQALVMSELRQSLGEAHDLLGSKMSIPDGQFNSNLAIMAPGGTSSRLLPKAHFVGVNTEKVSSNQLMMSGISSQLSPISVRLNYSADVAAGVLLTLFVMYDAILSINLPTRQVQTRV